eukprot:c34457_g1_i1 orf=26-214(+)
MFNTKMIEFSRNIYFACNIQPRVIYDDVSLSFFYGGFLDRRREQFPKNKHLPAPPSLSLSLS